MKNPWLEIQAEDYEGHMGSKSVCQFEPLRKIFNSALKKFSPKKLRFLVAQQEMELKKLILKK